MSDKSYNKWNSRRWQVTIWAMANISIFLAWSMIVKEYPTWFGIIMPILGAIPTAYIAAESYTKTHLPKLPEGK